MNEIAISIRARLEDINQQIEMAALRAGRKSQDIKLIVVTKKQPLGIIEAAIQAGASDFGENYPEEAVPKISQIQQYSNIKWHMIGHLQSRKIDLVVKHFHMMHSLDNLHLAKKMEWKLSEIGKTMPVLIEVNVGGELTKGGWPAWNEGYWEKIASDVEEIRHFSHLDVLGIMTMPPLFPEPEIIRPFYKKVRDLQAYLRKCFPNLSCSELSMGTSSDFRVAIEEGATMIRIGHAILGQRMS